MEEARGRGWGPYDGGMRMLRRAALAFAALVVFLGWLWGAAVRSTPEVRRRKVEARHRRLQG